LLCNVAISFQEGVGVEEWHGCLIRKNGLKGTWNIRLIKSGRKIAVKTGLKTSLIIYNGDLETGLVKYSNCPKQSRHHNTPGLARKILQLLQSPLQKTISIIQGCTLTNYGPPKSSLDMHWYFWMTNISWV
jgi:hypothetical protein